MNAIRIRESRPADGQSIMQIQAAHAGTFNGAVVVPLEVYAHPAFDGGRNILCAVDEDDRPFAYAPLFPSPAPVGAEVPNTFWAEIKPHPRHKERAAARSQLLVVLLERARELSTRLPEKRSRVCLQYVSSETASIEFADHNGFRHLSSMFTLSRDLVYHPPGDPAAPQGITVRRSQMTTAAEREHYLAARNSSLPYAAWSMRDLEYLLESPLFERGAAFTGYDGDAIAGSVMAYWDVDELRRLDPLGYTEQVFVIPSHRGRGLATHLLEVAGLFLANHGLRHARLEVLASNKQAVSLYEKLGYRIVAEQLVYERQV